VGFYSTETDGVNFISLLVAPFSVLALILASIHFLQQFGQAPEFLALAAGRRLSLFDALFRLFEVHQPDVAEAWFDVHVGRLAGHAGPREAVLHDVDGTDNHVEKPGVGCLIPAQ